MREGQGEYLGCEGNGISKPSSLQELSRNSRRSEIRSQNTFLSSIQTSPHTPRYGRSRLLSLADLAGSNGCIELRKESEKTTSDKALAIREGNVHRPSLTVAA
eukprot:754449-Hanusia_phi.AAC.4